MTDWRVWGFTSVIYPHGDIFAFVMGVVSLLPQVLIVAFVASNLTAFHENWVFVHIALGFNEALNFIIKSLVRESRPLHPCPLAARNDFGFPSSHAQFMFCFATLVARQSRSKMTNFILFSAACLVSVSRVWNEFHTVRQVVVGAIVGCLSGLFFNSRPIRCLIEKIVTKIAKPLLLVWYRQFGIAQLKDQ